MQALERGSLGWSIVGKGVGVELEVEVGAAWLFEAAAGVDEGSPQRGLGLKVVGGGGGVGWKGFWRLVDISA